MGKTIVQEYGPIYGEPVNGTVLGRPNGSVYVPISNIINLSTTTEYIRYVDTNRVRMCKSNGSYTKADYYLATALSQDLSSNMRVVLYSDAELETVEASRDFTAGQFNYEGLTAYNAVGNLEDGDTVYLVAYLMNNGMPVATSNSVALTMVVPS